jgi:hypothetical protein
MALELGTNCGLVSSAPIDNPAEYEYVIDGRIFVMRDVIPATAVKIVEIGWWCNSASEEANFEVGLYDDDGGVVPGEAGTLLYSDTTNAKGTDAGWKRVTVDWDVIALQSTNVWLAVQLDATASNTDTDWDYEGGSGIDTKTESSLVSPLNGGSLIDSDALFAIYAVWEAAGGGRTTKNTRTTILGQHIGQGFRM